MPSHSISSAFTQLLVNANCAPWKYPTWLELTKVPHGLFPDDDSKLPAGWTREDVNSIIHYFDEYRKIDNETDCLQYTQKTRGRIVPGQRLWREFLKKSSKWNLHGIIVEGLCSNNIHPLVLQLMSKEDKWPQADMYLPMALDHIRMMLFGPEAFEGQDLLPMKVRNGLKMIVQQSWDGLSQQAHKGQEKLKVFEAAALSAFEGMSHNAYFFLAT